VEIIEIGLRKKEEEIKENEFEFISFPNFLGKHLFINYKNKYLLILKN